VTPAEGELEIESDGPVITVRGDLDMETVGRLTEALDQYSGPVVLVLDELRFVDSSGLQGIVNAQRAARERGHDLILRRPSEPLIRVLEMTDLRGAFVIEP
jgi:anti-sigma B factor antagonist